MNDWNDFQDDSGAVICGENSEYRYLLWRIWDRSKPLLGFLMLNPSTADASADDPTIRKCKGFAERGGFGGIIVANQYAWRATQPSDLPSDIKIAEGPLNYSMIITMMRRCEAVCLAWGNYNFKPRRPISDETLYFDALDLDCRLVCIGKNANGSPKHPLMPSYKHGLNPYFEENNVNSTTLPS